MPLEIKEIVVTATITEDSNASSTPAAPNSTMNGVNRDELIADCVEQVLDILREKNER